MKQEDNRIAALANMLAYNSEATSHYVDGAPHLKHASLRSLYSSLIFKVYNMAARRSKPPTILDLGAGEGTVTLPFLEMGANVIAVDISESQLAELSRKCEKYNHHFKAVCQDIFATVEDESLSIDIVVLNSFVHHIPDYISLLHTLSKRLNPGGIIFTFQDPMRYDRLGVVTRTYSFIAYYSWRIMKGDLLGGLSRFVRRSRGNYREDSVHDNSEYHVVRNGVDELAIYNTLRKLGFAVSLKPYFSTQSIYFQTVGERLKLLNTFSIVAQKCE